MNNTVWLSYFNKLNDKTIVLHRHLDLFTE